MSQSVSSSTASSEPLWHHVAASDVAHHLRADLSTGLPTSEVALRQQQYGINELQGHGGKSPLVRFLMGFHQPLIYILLGAAAVALVLQDWVDAGVILAVILINTTIGFLQESKAENAIATLAQSVTTTATVIREGQKQQLNSRDLVPGDLVLLSAGDKVPADLRLFQVRNLQVSEAALTGESVPVQKSANPLPPDTGLADRHNMAYGGSLVTSGQARGIVVAIGNQTQTGQISQMMAHSSGLVTPLTRKIDRFSKTLLYVILALAAGMFTIVMTQQGSWTAGFKAAVALAVSAIPEGLPAVITVALAIGVGRMAQRHAIIRKLPAVETLGSTTVICSDKTGTLTENQMTVQAIYAGGEAYQVSGIGYGAEGAILKDNQPVCLDSLPPLQECLQCGLLCNDSHLQTDDSQISVAGDPTEGALIVSAHKAGLTLPMLEAAFPRLDTIPFESQIQYMATLHRVTAQPDCDRIYVKGSVEAILQRCQQQLDTQGNPIELDRVAIEQAVQTFTNQGLRVLAFARKQVSPQQQQIDHDHLHHGLTFLGLQGMIDPPRADAIAAVKTCQSAGIQVKMITGDHALTATAIARQMGLTRTLDAPTFTGQALAAMADADLANALETSAVFARVAPEQKLRLVKALQSRGEIVAMTGDGVNDAPALKQADIGVAMGINGTEVAKEAADMILTDDDFASIEAAVEEGRTVYGNLLKTIGFILPVNGGEALTILVGVLVAAALPILPVQILWVNMVSSVALSATLAFEPKVPGIMQRPPRPANEPLLSGKLLWRVLVISLFNLVAVFGMFEWVWQATANLTLARTMAVHSLVAAETFYLLSISQFIPSLWARLRRPPQDMRQAVACMPAIGVGGVLLLQSLFSQVAAINPLFDTQPLTLIQAMLCISAGMPVILPALLLKRFVPLI